MSGECMLNIRLKKEIFVCKTFCNKRYYRNVNRIMKARVEDVDSQLVDLVYITPLLMIDGAFQ